MLSISKNMLTLYPSVHWLEIHAQRTIVRLHYSDLSQIVSDTAVVFTCISGTAAWLGSSNVIIYNMAFHLVTIENKVNRTEFNYSENSCALDCWGKKTACLHFFPSCSYLWRVFLHLSFGLDATTGVSVRWHRKVQTWGNTYRYFKTQLYSCVSMLHKGRLTNNWLSPLHL